MFKRFATGALTVLVTFTVAAAPAAAQSKPAPRPGETVTLFDSGIGGCQAPGYTWGVDGAYAYIAVDDWVVWNSKQSFHVRHSYADGDLFGCRNGYHYSGGAKAIDSRWTVRGTGIVSCSIGWGANCDVNNETYASDYFNSGWYVNNNGVTSIRNGGGNVYTQGQASRIDNYQHDASTVFKVGAVATRAQSSNFAYRGF